MCICICICIHICMVQVYCAINMRRKQAQVYDAVYVIAERGGGVGGCLYKGAYRFSPKKKVQRIKLKGQISN